jgi:hypothetical protein
MRLKGVQMHAFSFILGVMVLLSELAGHYQV